MNPFEYMPLNSWLSNADKLYLDGRILWFHQGIDGSCVLLWLAVEQLIKTLIFQKRILDGEYSSKNDKDTYEQFHLWGKKLNHWLEKNISEFDKYYQKVINSDDRETLIKIYEFFNRRYYKNTSTGIKIDLLYSVDKIYFKLRDLVDEDLPIAFIDEIDLAKKGQYPFTLTDYTKYMIMKNACFRARTNYRT